ncbi:nuclease-related domain-containing protein [Pseudarthrobacter sp. C1]|uniref:nuclease-related domain-containing protein n=1 Tax=Pseudarthrobacter sp. C1 TaxID=3108940 RepID=UPI002B05E4BC|nr:nuclease-related domain-containing protein [Pseudarthrobacter sp. C1]MEA3550569.1 nuclease-related domain-containing protein [Pseudarthrobacter sp. C1]
MTAGAKPLLLGTRVPAQAVIEELMAVQSFVPPRTWLQRVFGANPLGPESLPWYKGALGEITVGRTLEGLGPEWLVLHAIPVGKGSSDIDHLLVGPAGVFTVNTKNHSGQSVWVAGRTLMVAGRKTRHLYNAAYEAARASKLLSAAVGTAVDVTGMVVVVDPKSLTIKSQPDQVVVVGEGQLLGWLGRRGGSWVRQKLPGSPKPPCWHRHGTGRRSEGATQRRSNRVSTPSVCWWSRHDGGGQRGRWDFRRWASSC